MKKLFLIFVLCFCILTAHSQTDAGGGFRRAGTNSQIKGMHKKQLMDTLGLTEEQANKVDAIQQDYKLKMRAVKLDTKLNDTVRQTRLDELKQERFEKLGEVISKEQLAKLDGMKMKKETKKPKRKKHYRKPKKA